MSVSRRNGLYPNSGAFKGSRSQSVLLILQRIARLFIDNGKKAPGTLIKYKAKDGYEGKDDLVVLEIGSSGMAFQRIAHIVVHKRSKSK
jgi:hypothetical protein